MSKAAAKTISVSLAKRRVLAAIREVCRSKPTEHESFETICDLHPEQIEYNLIQAVSAALAAAKTGSA